MQILYGKYPAELIYNEIQVYLSKHSFFVCFAIIQIGSNPASSVYINHKLKKSKEIGIHNKLLIFDESISFNDLKQCINDLNSDDNIHGIIVQLPLPDHLKDVIQYIAPQKDIDGLTAIQQGNLLLNLESLIPCTAVGVIKLLEYYKIDLESKKIAVIGRSNLVGKPLSLLLVQKNALISIFHSKIKENLFKEDLKKCDVICSAVGSKYFIKANDIKNGSILIDIGVTKEDKVYGDFDPECFKKCFAYTPNPGGIGPMTIACLMHNILKAYKIQHNLL